MGPYCSFCERRIATMLEVEHIQPKGLIQYRHLTGAWTNFLLACRNCNGTKSNKDVVLTDVLLPDRDNTIVAFEYLADGRVLVAQNLDPLCEAQAAATLRLTEIDYPTGATLDQNGRRIALDRGTQRMEAWSIAQVAWSEIQNDPENQALRRMAAELARQSGFFSIWMTVFRHDMDMRRRLIDSFPGTGESECFSLHTTEPITPAPNPDNLTGGGKL
jgi:uncharacterized protein (TIGR02646 family)